MLKSNYKTTNNVIINSLIELGDDLTADTKGKGRKFVSKFIEPGVAHYEEFGDVLITKETLDKFINTMVGAPVIIKHKDITDKNADKERVGVISNVWFNEMDGWYYCDGIIWDKQAIDLVKNQGWNVSCTYDFESDKQPKTHNGKKIDMEFTDGEFLHLALVDNPRYERANIVMNSKDEEQTTEKNSEVENSLTSIFAEAIAEVVTNCLGELRAENKNDEPKDWITIKGNHIPVFDNKKDTAKKFVEEKQEKATKQGNKQVHKNILNTENKNRNLKYEVGTVFDENGNIIKEISSNNEGEIDLKDQNLDYMNNKILTHNHPDGSPLSASDIATGFGNNIKLTELRATTIQGATYSLKPNENYTKEKAMEFAKEYSNVPLNAAKSFKDLCKEELAKGTLDIDFLKSNIDNLFKVYAWKEAEKFLEQNAQKYGFEYKKEE